LGAHDISVAGGSGGETADAPARAVPVWNRFAHWPAFDARLALVAFFALLVVSALVPVNAGPSEVKTRGFVENLKNDDTGPSRPRDDDLALYDIAIERIQGGEHYYDFIVEEQRAARYPVTPGIAVRLPTLAYIDAWLGKTGQTVAAIILLIAVLAAWWRRLGDEPGGKRHRAMAMALLMMSASLGLNRYFFVLHELWAGMLLALAFGLHRPGKWGWALIVGALALAIREMALPFVLLMAAMAFWRRDWKEGAAWSALALVFLALFGVHLHLIAQQVLPGDPSGQGWLYLRGLSGWISNVALSSNLRFLPHWLAGPALILAMLGWAAWRSPAGLFGLLLFLGYGLIFMIVGRPDNFYWGMLVSPAMFIGIAFAPMGLAALIGGAAGRRTVAESATVK